MSELKVSFAFDKTNPNWSSAEHENEFFLQATQNHANDLLRAQGHVTINRLSQMLGMPETAMGAIAGWTMTKPRSFISFDLKITKRQILVTAWYNSTNVFYSNAGDIIRIKFDAKNRHWSQSPHQNQYFLQSQQHYANDLLQVRGYLSLKDLFNMIGIKWDPELGNVGWILENEPSIIDFGITGPIEEPLEIDLAFNCTNLSADK